MIEAFSKFINRILDLGKFGGVVYVIHLLSADYNDWLLWLVVSLYLFNAFFEAMSCFVKDKK